jgi:hypothetical protein
MPESDARDEKSAAPLTPRVSGEVSTAASSNPASSASRATPLPSSSMRAVTEEQDAEPSASLPGDTLLSAGKPAARREVLFDDRLSAIDQQLSELQVRVRTLEQKKPVEPKAEPRTRSWLWVVFLVALAAVFQLLRLAQ